MVRQQLHQSDERYLLFLRPVVRLRTTFPFLIVIRCSLAGPRLVTLVDGLVPVFVRDSIRSRSPVPVLVMLLLCLPLELVEAQRRDGVLEGAVLARLDGPSEVPVRCGGRVLSPLGGASCGALPRPRRIDRAVEHLFPPRLGRTAIPSLAGEAASR